MLLNVQIATMKTQAKLLSSSLQIFSAAIAKVCVMATVLCVCCNTLVPRFAIDAIDQESMAVIFAQQSSLLCFFSFSSLPMKIVNNLVRGTLSGTVPVRHCPNVPPKKQSSHPADSSSDYSMVRIDKLETAGNHQAVRAGIDSPDPCCTAAGGYLLPALSALSRCFSFCPTRWCHFSNTLIFVLLPRSSINEDAYLNSMQSGIPAGVRQAGFFICVPKASIR